MNKLWHNTSDILTYLYILNKYFLLFYKKISFIENW